MTGIDKDVMKAIAFSLVGTACFTPIFAAGKLMGADIPILLIVFMRFLGGFVSTLGLALATRAPIKSLKASNPAPHVLRAMLSLGGVGTTIYAAANMRLADATAIGLLEGLLIIGLAALLLGESVRRAHWTAGFLCAAGAYIVLFGDSGFSLALTTQEWIGAAVALAGAVILGLEALVLKVVARRDSAYSVILHVTGISCLLVLFPATHTFMTSSLTLADLVPLLWIGPLATIGQLFNIKAYRLADVSILGPVNYSWILFATLLGWFAFEEIPGWFTILGALLILIGGAKLARIPPMPADPTRSLLRHLPARLRKA